jgi:hypothetical protein
MRTFLLISLLVLAVSSSANAEPKQTPKAAPKAAPAVHHPVRRAAKHDQAKSAEERATRVHVIDTVVVFGRAQRPMAVFDTNVRAFKFPVGTARYSTRDERYVPRAGKERW